MNIQKKSKSQEACGGLRLCAGLEKLKMELKY